ncbi:amino acid ABC transporter membrane protein (PAAT family) [Scopulibacillus darangshiensis]|uniref:Amino acid ABC transporter membrane protein (PAAT family) n=1 Tax=Scopulibacillus darangshiensis TaxID=442528 RepID=A0A4R2NXU7_9BACL|nr:amino acid ABC transporter permease [Scopulibacillus darangshiensis]TCP27059.1 amino acid ABC transporter membrane protein (PAAT family) [Scopulibacillus darangshiensis]
MSLHHIFDVELAVKSLPYVIQGLGYTVLIAFLSMFFGLSLGFIISLFRSSERFILRLPARVYISFMRGIPMLALLMIIYFALPVVGIQFTAVTAAMIAFSINSAAYIAEIIRASLMSVGKGQWDAAYALGFNKRQALMRIIVPQASRIAVPPLLNVFLDLVKTTSLASSITVPELLYKAQIVAGRSFDSMTMYILIALIYWVICILISTFGEKLEKRLSASYE